MPTTEKREVNTLKKTTQRLKGLSNSRNQKGKKLKNKLLFPVMALSIVFSTLIQRYLAQNWKKYSFELLGWDFHYQNNEMQRISIFKQTLLIIAVLEFIIAMTIMHIRIIGQKIRPVAEKDPLSISLLNRILSNNIQQAFIFFSLYGYLIFGQQKDFSAQLTYSLPLLFLVGRLSFVITYILATITSISTFRSFGFAFTIGVNSVMVQLIFEKPLLMNRIMFG